SRRPRRRNLSRLGRSRPRRATARRRRGARRAASGGGPGHMAEAGNNHSGRLKECAEEAVLPGRGAVALGKERADELVGELTQKGKFTQEDARQLVDDA